MRLIVVALGALLLGVVCLGGIAAADERERADFTAAGLHAEIGAYRAKFGGADDYAIPLDAKAEFFERVLWEYHATADDQVYCKVELSSDVGEAVHHVPGADSSTWNGALLAALSYRYAVTRDGAVLESIARLLRGLHRFQTVTTQSGYLVRSMCREAEWAHAHMKQVTTGEGETWHYWDEPAKGTYNQVVAGYAVMMMLAYADLPGDVQAMAREDLARLVLHVVDHDYHLTRPDGERTRYGDLTPLVASVGVPFNAQVAYQIVAAGFTFPGEDGAAQERIRKQFVRLRGDHHVYYEDPRRSLVRPQRVAASPFVKGMNDRNHVIGAAYVGLMLERYDARRRGVAWNEKFVKRLGQTMYWGAESLAPSRNSLCNFMWAAVLSDPAVLNAIVVRRERGSVQAAVSRGLVDGVEQLRRFRLDRFQYQGEEVRARQAVWNDQARPDPYYWKCNPRSTWKVTGEATNMHYAAIDYLHAYWMMRYYGLERREEVKRRHGAVLVARGG